MLRFAVPALLLLSGCAMTAEESQRQAAADAREEAKLAKELAGYTPSAPVNCIDPRSTNVQIYGDTLVYSSVGRRKYRVDTNGGCFGLRRDDIIVTRSFSSQLCRGDLVRTVDRTSGFPSGACTFGEFVPYTRDRG